MFIFIYKRKHSKFISQMLEQREMDTALIKDLPQIGYIVLTDNDVPVAAGFLRKVEGKYGLLDSYITNPELPSSLRNEALDLITSALIQRAQDEGIIKLIEFTEHENIHQRALSHGFGNLPMHFGIHPLK